MKPMPENPCCNAPGNGILVAERLEGGSLLPLSSLQQRRQVRAHSKRWRDRRRTPSGYGPNVSGLEEDDVKGVCK